jgi:hypothetical protein
VDTADGTAVVEAGADTAAVDIQDTAIFFSLNEQNCALPWIKTGKIPKTSRYILSKQEGTEKPSHATVPLKG